MRLHTILAGFLALALLTPAPRAVSAQDDAYAAMLVYLTSSRLDGHALNGANGAIGINLAAGDDNQQANLRAFALGEQAAATTYARQWQRDNQANRPDVALARIGGQALGNASGLVSINQASGTANLELNSVSVVSAQQGIREASADQWLADVCACAQETSPTTTGQPVAGTRRYAALVEASAMRGAQGVVQVNQIAGSGNVTANQLSLGVGLPPR